MNYLFYCRHFFLLLSVFLFSSCSIFSVYEDVNFKLPEKSSWKISTSAGEEFFIEGDSIVVKAVKNEPLALVGRSLASGKSAGAIYPFNEELEEKYSFPAQVLYSLVLSSVNTEEEKMYCLSTFNWQRFEDDCVTLGDNIWKVNKEIIMKKIAGGTFKKSDLKIEKTK